ncbi:MAG: hypothetical protein U1E49_11945 [Hyphomicrobiaceae bacterium]
MPMGSGFNLWEMVDLWKQVRKIWPVFRQAFRKERDAHDARLSAQAMVRWLAARTTGHRPHRTTSQPTPDVSGDKGA